jgi:hypothetical protein
MLCAGKVFPLKRFSTDCAILLVAETTCFQLTTEDIWFGKKKEMEPA